MSNYESAAREIWKPWYDQNYQVLIESFKKSIEKHINIFREKNPDKEVYGYSIYTCNGFPHFGPVLNTTDELVKKDSDPYYKYCPDEWSDWDDCSCFDTTKEIIESLHGKFDEYMERFEGMYEEGDSPINEESDLYWQQNVEKIFQSALQALMELKSEGAFDWLENSNQLIFIWFSDPSDWEFEMARKSIESLVGSERAEEFSATLK